MSVLRWRGPQLPVEAALPALRAGLQEHGAVVLVAPPGSGKTTRVPPALLEAGLVAEGQVLVLQPRRLAARRAGRTIAGWLGVRPGEEVGWQVRFENRTGRSTRIVLMTEGMLTRRLQADPFLDGVSAVILDEFHERGAHADLLLAVLRQLRSELRPELKLVVMSATLDPEPVARFLGGAPVVRAEGRRFPVTVHHRDRPVDERIEAAVADAVVEALAVCPEGHVLAFLPGVGEIERTAARLRGRVDLPVRPLHGRLPLAVQDAALQPTEPRTVVLATNIAETSVTMPGVRAVVDAGLERVSVFDPSLGISVLRTVPCSVASADQRAGRAGRTGPGTAWRLWTRPEHHRRAPAPQPELQRADLSELLLFLADLGEDPGALQWLEPLPAAALARARTLLDQLGAIDEAGDITALGRALAALPVHPRLGRVVVAGHAGGVLRAAATAAALMAERDPWGAPGVAAPADLLERIAAVDGGGRGGDRGALAQVRRVRDQLIRLARRLEPVPQDRGAGLVDALVAGFPERVGLRSGPGRGRLSTGLELRVARELPIGASEAFLAVAVRASERGATLACAAPLDPAELRVPWRATVRWDPDAQRVRIVRERRLGALLFATRPPSAAEREALAPAAAALLLAEARRAGVEVVLQPSPAVRQLQARLALLQRRRPELQVAATGLEDLLPHVVPGRRSFAELARVDLLPLLRGLLDHRVRQRLDRDVPPRWRLPTGREVRLDYGDGSGPPVLSARIQQLFGLRETPRVLGEAVVVELLAPNQRPAQVTRDLAGFWTGSYQAVRKELRGRYPKHAWPEDPLSAPPQDRPGRRR